MPLYGMRYNNHEDCFRDVDEYRLSVADLDKLYKRQEISYLIPRIGGWYRTPSEVLQEIMLNVLQEEASFQAICELTPLGVPGVLLTANRRQMLQTTRNPGRIPMAVKFIDGTDLQLGSSRLRRALRLLQTSMQGNAIVTKMQENHNHFHDSWKELMKLTRWSGWTCKRMFAITQKHWDTAVTGSWLEACLEELRKPNEDAQANTDEKVLRLLALRYLEVEVQFVAKRWCIFPGAHSLQLGPIDSDDKKAVEKTEDANAQHHQAHEENERTVTLLLQAMKDKTAHFERLAWGQATL